MCHDNNAVCEKSSLQFKQGLQKLYSIVHKINLFYDSLISNNKVKARKKTFK